MGDDSTTWALRRDARRRENEDFMVSRTTRLAGSRVYDCKELGMEDKGHLIQDEEDGE
jgi:hypothetical protein